MRIVDHLSRGGRPIETLKFFGGFILNQPSRESCSHLQLVNSMSHNAAFIEDVPRELQALDESFRCGICQELYNVAVTIAEPSCGHSFCSACIRLTFRAGMTGLRREASCPKCRCVVAKGEKSLIPNRALQEAVLQYKTFLLVVPATDKKRSLDHPSKNDNVTNSLIASQSITRQSKRIKQQTDKEDSSDDNEQSVDQPPMTLQKRPSTHYSSLKKKQLQELCAREGLPTNGTEEDLKARHHLFVTLWNAETDSIQPKTPAELVDEVARRERTRQDEKRKEWQNGVAVHSQCMKQIVEARERLGKGEEVKIKSANESFNLEMRNNFARLIAQGRARQAKARAEREKSEAANEESVILRSSPPERAQPGVSKGGDLPHVSAKITGQAPSPTSTDEPVVSSGKAMGDNMLSNRKAIGDSNTSADLLLRSNSQRPTLQDIENVSSNTLAPDSGRTTDGKVVPVINLENESDSQHTITFSTASLPLVRDKLRSSLEQASATSQSQALAEEKKRVTSRTVENPYSKRSRSASKISSSVTSREKALCLVQNLKPETEIQIESSSPTAKHPRYDRPRAYRSISGPWQCNFCTFRNEVRIWTNANCQMCNMPRKGPQTFNPSCVTSQRAK